MAAFAQKPKISPDLRPADPGAKVDVIVQFQNAPDDTHFKKVKDKGGVEKARLPLVKGGLFAVPAAALAALAANPDVAYISPDRQVAGSLDYVSPTMNAGIAWQYGWEGNGVGVAVIDSGVGLSADLRSGDVLTSRVVYRQSFVGSNPNADEYGHGTHVAGIVAGNGKSSTGSIYTRTFKGIAPMAQVVSLKVLDMNGIGTDSGVIAAIQRAIELKSTYNIRIINLSLGRPVFESYTLDPLCQAVEAAWKAGIVVVVAAGNEGRNNSLGTNGYATITSPGNDPYVITVGAMKTLSTTSRADDRIASYSSKGPTLLDHVVKPDLVAPGNRIVSTNAIRGQLCWLYPQNWVPFSYYTNTPFAAPTPMYYYLSGTSMATPVVSGAAALMLQRDPGLTPDQVKARLMKTASKSFPSYSTATDPDTGVTYTSQYDIFTVGAGYLDIWAALNNANVATGAALSPTAVYDAATGKVRIALGTSVVWGDTGTWGTSLVWGDSVLVQGGSLVWGDTVVWGMSSSQGFSVVWGDSLVWGDGSPISSESTRIAIAGEN